MLSAISNYLQQLPYPQQTSAAPVEVSKVKDTANTADTETSSLDGYAPSTRVFLIGAVASDFNVRSLSSQDVNALQHQVQQYGLLNGRDLDAFSVLNNAYQQEEIEQGLDAVSYLDTVVKDFDSLNTPYSERQQIVRLHRLMHNLDSAHQVLNTRVNLN